MNGITKQGDRRMTVREVAEEIGVHPEQVMDVLSEKYSVNNYLNENTELTLKEILAEYHNDYLEANNSFHRQYEHIQALKDLNESLKEKDEINQQIIKRQDELLSITRVRIDNLINILTNGLYSSHSFNWYEFFGREKTGINKKSGFVYLAYDGRYYKIGATKDLERRKNSLRTGNVKFEIIASVQSNDAFGLENSLHNMFAEKNIDLEWFDLNDDDIDVLINLFFFRREIAI
jgi:hypothetical protein